MDLAIARFDWVAARQRGKHGPVGRYWAHARIVRSNDPDPGFPCAFGKERRGLSLSRLPAGLGILWLTASERTMVNEDGVNTGSYLWNESQGPSTVTTHCFCTSAV